MRSVYVRILVGAVGVYALAKALVIAAALLFLLIQMDIASGTGLPRGMAPVMVASFLALGAVGLLLLLKPPKRILTMLTPAGSSLLGILLGVLGLLVMVLALEELIDQIGSASLEGRGGILPDTLSMLVPVLIAMGGVWLLRAPRRHRQEDLDFATPLPPHDVWRLAAVMLGLWSLNNAVTYMSALLSVWSVSDLRAFGSLGFQIFVQLIIGIYLVIGAPGLVRWHLERIDPAQAQDSSATPVDSEN